MFFNGRPFFSEKKTTTHKDMWGILESNWHMHTRTFGKFLVFRETGENKITPGPRTK